MPPAALLRLGPMSCPVWSMAVRGAGRAYAEGLRTGPTGQSQGGTLVSIPK